MANWSKMRKILVSYLSGPNFALRDAEIDGSRSDFGEMLFQDIAQKKSNLLLSGNLFSYTFGGQF